MKEFPFILLYVEHKGFSECRLIFQDQGFPNTKDEVVVWIMLMNVMPFCVENKSYEYKLEKY